MVRYTVVIEKDPASDWGAYVPGLPGCFAVGPTSEEVEQLIREAIPLHIPRQASLQIQRTYVRTKGWSAPCGSTPTLTT